MEIQGNNIPRSTTNKHSYQLQWFALQSYSIVGNGEISTKSLSIIAADYPSSCTICGRDHNQIDQYGWKIFKSLAKKEKKMLRLQNQSKLRSCRTAPKFKFGYQMPRTNDYDHDLSIDKHDGNNKWAEAIKLEIDQKHAYDTCKDMGEGSSSKGHKHIRAHFVFDAKHDGRHKARLVADGQLTDFSLSSIYSGVVRGIRIVLF